MKIDATDLHFRTLNEKVRESGDREIIIENCMGHRYIGSGMDGVHIMVHGMPGNALGAYLNGADITVMGNAQDATGDTMNEGRIIYVEKDAGYRAGIHMKAYQNKLPVLVIGGCAGSFLGEYQAGGLIVVLGLGREPGQPLVGNFCATGMHGGKILLRGDAPKDLSPQVLSAPATEADMAQIEPHLETYAAHFGISVERIKQEAFTVLAPDTKNPYKQLYTHN